MTSFHALESVLAASLIVVLVYGPWQSACTDLARQRMFKNRDALFDLGRSGDLAFESEASQTIRSEMNNLIRFAHGLTWVRIMLFARLIRGRGRAPAPIYAAVSSIEDLVTRRKVSTLVSDIEFAAIRMVLMKSPLLIGAGLLTVLPLIVSILCYVYARNSLTNVTKQLGMIIQSEAALIRA